MGEPKSDWGKDLCEEVEKLSDAVKDMQTQLQALAGQAAECKDFRKEIQPNHWFVTHARGFVILFAVLIVTLFISLVTGVVTFAFWLGSLGSDVRHNATAIAKVETSLEATAKESRQANEQLRQLVLERLPRQATTAFKHGVFARLEHATYTYHSDPPTTRMVTWLIAKTADGGGWRCILSPETVIVLDGKTVTRDDLKPGMHVEVTLGEGNEAALVQVRTTERIAPPKEAPPPTKKTMTGAEPAGKSSPVKG